MAVTYGFFNSVGGDRKYSALQMGSIFDGIIKDGIYQALGDAFAVTAGTGMQVRVGSGRAWFDRTWTLNDAPILLAISPADLLQKRIDVVVIEVNSTLSTRANSIKVVTGVATTHPVVPSLQNTETVHQYPLAYVHVDAQATAITNAKIENQRGTGKCPWVIGPLETLNASTLYASWAAQWNAWFANITADSNNIAEAWTEKKNEEFAAWMATLRTNLDNNAAAALLTRILDLESRMDQGTESRIVYDSLRDSNGESILDSSGNPIRTKLVYQVV